MEHAASVDFRFIAGMYNLISNTGELLVAALVPARSEKAAVGTAGLALAAVRYRA